jgi:hypothetical protein
MSARTAKAQSLRRQIDNALALIESCVILADFTDRCTSDAISAERQRERELVMDRECGRARQLIDQFIEVVHA